MGIILANEPLLQGVWGVSGGGAGAWSPDRAQGTAEAGLVLGDGPDTGEEGPLQGTCSSWRFRPCVLLVLRLLSRPPCSFLLRQQLLLG